MTVERIRKLDINNRPIFTGVYGYSYGQEFYVEDNLCKYNFWQELYRYLRSENYTTLFYNTEFNFFSYEEDQIETLFFRNPVEINGKGNDTSDMRRSASYGFIAPTASPNGKNRRKGIRLNQHQDGIDNSVFTPEAAPSCQPVLEPDSHQLVSHRPNAILVKKLETDQFFQLKNNSDVLKRVFDFMNLIPGHRLAIVFTMPSEISFGNELEEEWISHLQQKFLTQKHTDSHLRLIVIYDFKDVKSLRDSFQRGQQGFFFKKWFYDQMFPSFKDDQNDLYQPSDASFFIDHWGKDEIGNVLKRRRIMEGLDHSLAPIPFDDLCLRIWQQFVVNDKEIDEVQELMALPKSVLEEHLLKMDNEKAMDKLRKLWGMEDIIAQFDRYLADLRACRESGEKFRKHMVFMGNPGTGKTTVARIFADILREEGLLDNGRLHQVTVGDLVAGYVGQTRLKTLEVCQKARGGVLFIDEAYGLYQSGNTEQGGDAGANQFGKEAIEVLLQFMENDDSSLVIMAGYPEPMEDLLKNGNVGFNSRIGEQGRFMFEDYKPEVLLKIALSKLKTEGYTEDFSSKLLAIFSVLSRFKDKDWANARTAENTISKIKSNYRANNLTGPYDVDAIPDDLMRLIRILSSEEEKALLKELDGMIGLQKVKTELKKVFARAKTNRIRLEKLGTAVQDLPDLTFIFEGNPGTGKTTVARLMGKVLAGYGLIKTPDVKEYGKGQIISSVRGGSVKLVNEMFDDCVGKVLFIDEAYALAEPDCKDAVDQIVQNMTLPKYKGKMAIIMAGYPDDMQKLIDVNAGIERRFKFRIRFDDYSNEELTQMYKNLVAKKQMKLADGCDEKILEWFKSQKRGKNFGNAGLVEKIHQEVDALSAQRYYLKTDSGVDPDFYLTIMPEDIPDTVHFKKKSDEEIFED